MATKANKSIAPPLSHFTIGWVSAIHIEYVAARQMLDEEYQLQHSCQPKGKPFTYTYGRIGNHKVVLSCLPFGFYGTEVAEEVGEALRASFPAIRFVLMVGVAGGAPSLDRPRRDIRLGDVVVGHEVIPYEHTKAMPDGRIFNGPVWASAWPLLTGVHELMSRITEGHIDMDSIIAHSFVKSEKIKSDYRRPKDESDRLYQPDHVHKHGCDCLHELPNSKMGIEPRGQRDSWDRIKLHVGKIGSANVVVKDAQTRDALATQHNLMCFEMESVGLMRKFPCIPIRGICDYSDSHKNDRWQGYAAAAAAVCAKCLLEVIPAKDVQETSFILDADDIRKHIRPIIDEAILVMSSNLAENTTGNYKASTVLERISEAIDLMHQFSKSHTAKIQSATDAARSEAAEAHNEVIEANKRLMLAVSQNQNDLLVILSRMEAYLDEQMQSSSDSSMKKDLKAMKNRAQKDKSMVRKMADLTGQTVDCTSGILGEVAIIKKDPAIRSAAGWLEQYSKVVALAETLSTLVPRGMTRWIQKPFAKKPQGSSIPEPESTRPSIYERYAVMKYARPSSSSRPRDSGSQVENQGYPGQEIGIMRIPWRLAQEVVQMTLGLCS